MTDYFQSEYGRVLHGYTLSLRACVAHEIVIHFSLATGKADGEDTAGRTRLVEMPSAEVATRANDIADAIVTEWETRGWIKPVTLTQEQEAARAGQLERVRSQEAYKSAREELMGTMRRSTEGDTGRV